MRIATTAEGEKRGFAHVEFAEKASAEAAVQLSGKELLGQAVEVKAAVAHQRREPREGAARVFNPGEPAPGCWFCLTNQKDVHLIVSIQNECYLALDKARSATTLSFSERSSASIACVRERDADSCGVRSPVRRAACARSTC